MGAIQHPARHYIHYLLSKRIHDAKGVIHELNEHGLVIPKDDYVLEELVREILRARAGMTFPIGFNPRERPMPEATSRWLDTWRLRDMWANAPHVVAATALLAEPQVRQLLELLLLGPLSASAIAKRLSVRFGLPAQALNAGVVKAYGHYYWDATAMNIAQWRRYLSLHYSADAQTDYVAALLAPRSSAGAAFVVAIADKDPQLLSAADRYETASTMAFGMMMHHALSHECSTGHTYAAFQALNMMRVADEELARHRGASSDLIDELKRLQTIYDKAPPLKITEAGYIQRPVALEAKNPEIVDVPVDE